MDLASDADQSTQWAEPSHGGDAPSSPPRRMVLQAAGLAALSSGLLAISGGTPAAAWENRRRPIRRRAPAPTATSTATPTTQAANELFRADLRTAGLSKYRRVFPDGVTSGLDYGFTSDPAGAGQVVYLDNRRSLTISGTMPRVAAESNPIVRPLANGNSNDLYTVGTSFYIPAGSVPKSGSDWITLASVYGPPYGGPSPLGLGLHAYNSSAVRLILGSNTDLLGSNFTVPTDTWIRVTIAFKFAYNGWVQAWVDRGAKGKPGSAVPVRGKTRYQMPTMARGVNDGVVASNSEANSSRICAYGASTRILFGQHIVVNGFDSALYLD